MRRRRVWHIAGGVCQTSRMAPARINGTGCGDARAFRVDGSACPHLFAPEERICRKVCHAIDCGDFRIFLYRLSRFIPPRSVAGDARCPHSGSRVVLGAGHQSPLFRQANRHCRNVLRIIDDPHISGDLALTLASLLKIGFQKS